MKNTKTERMEQEYEESDITGFWLSVYNIHGTSHSKPEFGPISVCTICVCMIGGGSIALPVLFLRFDLQKEVEFSVNLPTIQRGA